MRGEAMFEDEERIRAPKPQLQPGVALDGFSIDELRRYVEVLKAEIARVEAEIARRRTHMEAAASLFGKADREAER